MTGDWADLLRSSLSDAGGWAMSALRIHSAAAAAAAAAASALRRRSGRRAWPLIAAALLSGCASFSPDGGFAAVEQTARERLGKDLIRARSAADQDRIDTRVAELLATPLTADAAVQLALLNNRGLQASLEDLRIGEAERVQAGRLPNPGFSFGRTTRGDEVEIERGLHSAWPVCWRCRSSARSRIGASSRPRAWSP